LEAVTEDDCKIKIINNAICMMLANGCAVSLFESMSKLDVEAVTEDERDILGEGAEDEDDAGDGEYYEEYEKDV